MGTRGMAFCIIGAVVLVATAPGEALGQHCRRSCESGEARDARGCCIPARAKPKQEPARKRPPAKDRQKPADADKPDAADEARRREARRARRRKAREEAQEAARERAADRNEAPDTNEAPAAVEQADESEPAEERPAVVPEQATEAAPEVESAPSKPAAAQVMEDPPGLQAADEVPSARGDIEAGSASEQAGGLPGASSIEAHVATRRPWPAWMPWAVAGAGAAVTAAGGVLYWRAARNYERFDMEFVERCASGCAPDDPNTSTDRLHRAEWQEQAAKISFATGGAVLAAGLVLMLVDGLESEHEQRRDLAGISVVPSFSSGTAGITAGISF